MNSYNRILVGVNLSRCSPFSASFMDLATVDTAIALAHASGAELLFLTVFNTSDQEEAVRVLDGLVERAACQGVTAHRQLALGKPWREIIRQVVQGEHDLAVVGAHRHGGLSRLRLGNTTLKLLRRCPCPVWICKSPMVCEHRNILVATDLSPASDLALRHGIMLGSLLDARVQLLHVTTFRDDPLGDGELGGTLSETQHCHQEVLGAAARTMHDQLELTAFRELGVKCEVHLVEDVGDPAYRIERFVEANDVDLLVLGTVARHGLAGLIFGNAAERLLPRANCSLFVTKALGFQCPVRLNVA